MGRLYWPETVGLTRYSIPSHTSPSPSNLFLQPTYQNNSIDDHIHLQTPKLFEIIKSHDETTSSNDIQLLYDGLTSLNENRLDDMIETDLVSSSNG
jgi:hypothetical protein